ncbi:hypothetical protein LTS18_001958 [Coniosporium uncinatum]|uniref:Uncharacterized protein n=1 Tax=Coniosporium uncinatum TaxID=93489 RepID=A0ACC3DUJ7_9PEZI|nr:hypothetical protein LTS18_001958 [Coniosporium uncinatum]
MSTHSTLPPGVTLYSNHHGHERTAPPPYTPPTPPPPSYTTVDPAQFPNFYSTQYRAWNPSSAAGAVSERVSTAAYSRATYVELDRRRPRSRRGVGEADSQHQEWNQHQHQHQRYRQHQGNVRCNDTRPRYHHHHHHHNGVGVAEADNPAICAADHGRLNRDFRVENHRYESARTDAIQQQPRAVHRNAAPSTATHRGGGSIVGTIRWRRGDEGELVVSAHVRVRRPRARFLSSLSSDSLGSSAGDEEEEDDDDDDDDDEEDEIYDEDAEGHDEADGNEVESDNTNRMTFHPRYPEPEEAVPTHTRSSLTDLYLYPSSSSGASRIVQNRAATEVRRSVSVFRRVRTRIELSIRRLRRGTESQGRRDWSAYNAYAY